MRSAVLWDTIWSRDPALGTIGDWDIVGFAGAPPAMLEPLPPPGPEIPDFPVDNIDPNPELRGGMPPRPGTRHHTGEGHPEMEWEEALMTMEEARNSGGLKNIDPLGTAILLSIASDARLPDYMVGRFGFTVADQTEWHGNTTSMGPGEEPLGSLLWVLRRAPLTDYTAKMAEHFCAMALQPMIRQKLVLGFDITTLIDKQRNMLEIRIRAITKQGERVWLHDLYPIQ